MPAPPAMPAAVRRQLRCPICGSELAGTPAALTCSRGHAFDLARQGYASLLTGRVPAGAETAEMVAARSDVIAAGHFDVLTGAVVDMVADASPTWPSPPGLVVDVGAGTGHYLAAVLDRLPHHHGLALDVARAALRRAARAHPRAGAAACDIWRGLPLADSCADLVLNIFAPRNGAEFRRVLRTTGTLLVVTPRPDHLAELVTALGLLGVDPHKDRRLDATLAPWFSLDRRIRSEHRLTLSHEDAARVVAMGPSAWHVEPTEVATRLAQLPDTIDVRASVDLRRYRPRP